MFLISIIWLNFKQEFYIMVLMVYIEILKNSSWKFRGNLLILYNNLHISREKFVQELWDCWPVSQVKSMSNVSALYTFHDCAAGLCKAYTKFRNRSLYWHFHAPVSPSNFSRISERKEEMSQVSLKLISDLFSKLNAFSSFLFRIFWKFLIYSNHVKRCLKKISLQHRDYVISIIRVCKNSREQWKAVYVNCICTNEILVALNYLNYRQPLLQLYKCVYNINENIFSCLWY